MSLEELLKEIAEDRVSGASQLTIKAATLFLKLTEGRVRLRAVKRLARLLTKVRPSMPSIANIAVAIALETEAEVSAGAEVKDALERVVRRVVKEYQESLRTVVSNGVSFLSNYGSILTHSYSSTVAAVLEESPDIEVTVTESRPGLEGVKLAERLASKGLRVTLIVDAAAAYVMRDVEAVVVGCDALLQDGSFLNKVGTKMIALAAAEAGTPLYVFTDLWKAAVHGFEVEEHPPNEVYSGEAPLRARNPYFEQTPGKLVSRYVTEAGVMRLRELRSRLREVWETFSSR